MHLIYQGSRIYMSLVPISLDWFRRTLNVAIAKLAVWGFGGLDDHANLKISHWQKDNWLLDFFFD